MQERKGDISDYNVYNKKHGHSKVRIKKKKSDLTKKKKKSYEQVEDKPAAPVSTESRWCRS